MHKLRAVPHISKVLEARQLFLKNVQVQDKEILIIYKKASRLINESLKGIDPNSMKSRYLKEMQKSIDAYKSKVLKELKKSVETNIIKVSEIEAYQQLSFFDGLGMSEDLHASFKKMFTTLPIDILKTITVGNYYGDGKTLDDRLWILTKRNAESIETLIKTNIAKGVNARELSIKLDKYIDPFNRIQAKTLEAGMDKNISYQAHRLARTSLTHASNETYIQGSKRNPFAIGVKWNLSPQHYSRQVSRCGADVCDVYASQDSYGLGKGIYPPDKPPIEHPNGMCYLTTETVPIDKARQELIDWLNGEDNSKLDNWLDEYGEEFGIEKISKRKSTESSDDKYVMQEHNTNNSEAKVDWNKVNSKEYKKSFEGIGDNKNVDNIVYKYAVQTLKHRDNTLYEDLHVIDKVTGDSIAFETKSKIPKKINFSNETIEGIQNHGGKLILVHNHPKSTPFSIADINLLSMDESIDTIIACAHNGTVYIASDLKNKVNIADEYRREYTRYKELRFTDLTAMEKAWESLSKAYNFSFQRR